MPKHTDEMYTGRQYTSNFPPVVCVVRIHSYGSHRRVSVKRCHTVHVLLCEVVIVERLSVCDSGLVFFLQILDSSVVGNSLQL